MLRYFIGFSLLLAAASGFSVTSNEALTALTDGNQRFLSHHMQHPAYEAIMAEGLAPDQFPLGVVLSCMDSRSVPDILFDQDLGSIFGIRMAGNVADKNVLGSMEYAVAVVNAKVIVVLGHTQCGAVKGACQGVKLGNLTSLLQQMQPAVAEVKKSEGASFSCSSETSLDAIAKQNVIDQMHYILKQSPLLRKAIQDKTVSFVGAMHNLATGKVEFFDETGKIVGSS